MIRNVWNVLWITVALVGMLGCSNPTEPGNEQGTTESIAGEGTSVADASTSTGSEATPGPETAPGPEKPAEPEKVPMPTQKTFGEGKRAVEIQIPFGYDPVKPLPLLVVLHGYGANGPLQAAYLGFTRLQETEKFLMLTPNGTTDPTNRNFWNATDACCNFASSKVDDVAYIKGLIDEVKSVYRVDETKVFLVGHSNGGFMSYRMACDASNSITAIASLAGASFFDKSRCKPSRKVNILQIHGTNDRTILYNGGTIPVANKKYPSAQQSVDMWKSYNECSGERKASGTNRDLENGLAGNESTVQIVEGCPAGGAVELWAIQQGGHLPNVSQTFAKQVWDWFNEKTSQ